MTSIVMNKETAALIASVVIGVVLTFIWAEVSYKLLRRSYPEITGKDRSRVIGPLVGMIERLLLTTLTIWLQPAVGPIAASFFAVKAVLSWGELKDLNLRVSRARYAISFMNGMVSVTWAIICGIWATH
jgi:hypothetical protein